MANIEMWKPGLDDSAVSMDPNDPNFTNVNTALGGAGSLEKGLKNSGYIYGTPAAGATQLPTGTPFTAGASGWTPETLAEWQKTHNPDGSIKLESVPESFYNKTQQDLQALNASLGKFSDQDIYNMRSEAAGIVGGQFDPLINEAIEQKRQGMASSTVRAGQRGGFESTQIAGAAALAPIEGGNFVGQGGALERVKSAYDLNISNLQIKKQAAINEMFAALKKAKTDGDTAAFDRAMKLAEYAQKSEKDALDMALQKENITKAQRENTTATASDLATKGANNLIPYLTGDPMQDEALINQYATNNKLDPGQLKGAVRKIMDEQSFYKSGDIISLASKLPEGQSQTITDPNTGRQFTVTGTAEPDTFNVTDDVGRVTVMTKEGEVISRSAPGVGKTKTQPSNITINSAGARTPIVLDGVQVGYETYNEATGKTSFVSNDPRWPSADDTRGQIPEGAQRGTFGSGNPSSGDEKLKRVQDMMNSWVSGLKKIQE